MNKTKVKDLMTSNPTLISPNATLQDAAQKMNEINCGVLPVGSGNKLEGIITDRDIVVRAIAEGIDPVDATVAEYMSDRVYTCKENETLIDAADIMSRHEISRLVVQNNSGKVVGILSFGCIVRNDTSISEISEIIQHAVGRKAA